MLTLTDLTQIWESEIGHQADQQLLGNKNYWQNGEIREQKSNFRNNSDLSAIIFLRDSGLNVFSWGALTRQKVDGKKSHYHGKYWIYLDILMKTVRQAWPNFLFHFFSSNKMNLIFSSSSRNNWGWLPHRSCQNKRWKFWQIEMTC